MVCFRRGGTMEELHNSQAQGRPNYHEAITCKKIGRFASVFQRLIVLLLSPAVLLYVASCTFNEPLSEDLGIH